MKIEQKINKRDFYKEKVRLFKEHAEKYPDRDLLELYNEWIAENNIYGVDRHKIWKIVRKMQPVRMITIDENSDEYVRLKAVLDILLEADLKHLNRLIEKKYGKHAEAL